MLLKNYSDGELVALYNDSLNNQFLTELFTRHMDVLYRIAFRYMKNASDTEDALQVALCKICINLRSYNGTGSVVGWLIQVTINTCFEKLNSEKSRRLRERKVISERSPIVKIKDNELSETIENHLNSLPNIYRTPITLQFMEGLSVKEISEMLVIPENTIRQQINRGLEKLKASLQRVGFKSSVLLIGEQLSKAPKLSAPDIFKQSEYFEKLYQSKVILASKVATSSVVNSGLVASKVATTISTKIIITLIIFATTGVIGYSVAPLLRQNPLENVASISPQSHVSTSTVLKSEDLVHFDFEDGKKGEDWLGKIDEGPTKEGSRYCLVAEDVQAHQISKIYLRNGKKDLFTFKKGAVLTFQYWVDQKVGALDTYIWNATSKKSLGFFPLLNPVQKKWTTVSIHLSSLKSSDGQQCLNGDIISDLTIQTSPRQGVFFVDNINVSFPQEE